MKRTPEAGSSKVSGLLLPMLPDPSNGKLDAFAADHCSEKTPPEFVDGYHHLPVELFDLGDSYYAFDARNVCFVELNKTAFDMLTVLRERTANVNELVDLLPGHSKRDIRDAHEQIVAEQADGLLAPYHFRRLKRHEDDQYEHVLSQRMGGFTIFVTTRCNLGCSYCIYGGQYEQHEELTQQPMPWETLKATMDFLAAHSKASESIRLDFFGGEPLMAFPMIQRGVNYLKSILPADGPRVIVTITSNGTILTDAILDFLLEHDVYIQFSIDGGQGSHDLHRPFKHSKRGSFQNILRNLQRIHDRDPEYFRRNMRLKGVIVGDTLDVDDTEFFNHPLIRTVVDGGHFILLDLEPHYDLSKDGAYFERLDSLGRTLLQMRGLETEADLLSRLNVKQRSFYHDTFGRFFEAQAVNRVYFGDADTTPFTKGCLTGYQEGAVSANGDISICLKSAKGANFVIGNVLEGRWYYEKMQRLNTVFHEDWTGCSSCFVQKICDLCYEKLNGEAGQWVAGRSNFCEFNRERHRVIFRLMLRVMRNNPKLWNWLEEWLDERATAPPGPEDQFSSASMYREQADQSLG
jgi:uncharacterized protein